jgi:DNA-binding NarL/FixJ family response regulator
MIRVLLVDDQVLIRQGLRSLLEAKPDLEVVGDAENGQKALDLVGMLLPDVVLMDVRMPVMDGVTATRLIREQFKQTQVLILTTFDDDEYVTQAMRVGARGYLLKDTLSDELAQTIRSVHQGYTQMGPGLFEKAFSGAVMAPEPSLPLPPELMQLTPREQEVLRLIISGASNREIAAELYISERTVKNHITSILGQLGLRDRTQAAVFASPFVERLGQWR